MSRAFWGRAVLGNGGLTETALYRLGEDSSTDDEHFPNFRKVPPLSKYVALVRLPNLSNLSFLLCERGVIPVRVREAHGGAVRPGNAAASWPPGGAAELMDTAGIGFRFGGTRIAHSLQDNVAMGPNWSRSTVSDPTKSFKGAGFLMIGCCPGPAGAAGARPWHSQPGHVPRQLSQAQ